MKIWVVSDQHSDVAAWDFEPVEHDLLVIAGDLANGPAATIAELQRIQATTGKQVVFVPGNHDYGPGGFSPVEFCGLPDAISVLEAGTTRYFGDLRVIGATLWTDFEFDYRGVAAQIWAVRHMVEYRQVLVDGRPISARDIGEQHDSDRAAIEAALAQPHDGPTMVVTHHAPAAGSIPVGERGDERWPAYVSDLEELITRFEPEFWVHGHIHEAADYSVGSTRVVCNPRGYSRLEGANGHRPDFVIEI